MTLAIYSGRKAPNQKEKQLVLVNRWRLCDSHLSYAHIQFYLSLNDMMLQTPSRRRPVCPIPTAAFVAS